MPVKAVAVLAAVMVAAGTAGCAANSTGRPAGSPPSPATASSQPRAEGPVPASIQGTWTYVADPHITLILTATRYRVLHPPEDVRGDAGVSGTDLDFGDSTFCHSGTGRYSWTLANGRLTLHALAPDPCPGRSTTFDGGTFRR